MKKSQKESLTERLTRLVKNQTDMDFIFENLFSKINKNDTSPELWITIFVLQFANLENYLKQIVMSVISQAMRDKNILFDNDYDDMTFGQAINIFEEIFTKGRYLLKGSGSKMEYWINFNLQKIEIPNAQAYKIFELPYLTKYIARLRVLNKFRNDLYHNLFANNKNKNINEIIEEIKKIIDFKFIPEGTYNDYEFDETYYERVKALKGFAKEVEFKRKSLVSSAGQFPPEKYVSVNMLLRIMFYHYSFTMMNLKRGVNF